MSGVGGVRGVNPVEEGVGDASNLVVGHGLAIRYRLRVSEVVEHERSGRAFDAFCLECYVKTARLATPSPPKSGRVEIAKGLPTPARRLSSSTLRPTKPLLSAAVVRILTEASAETT